MMAVVGQWNCGGGHERELRKINVNESPTKLLHFFPLG